MIGHYSANINPTMSTKNVGDVVRNAKRLIFITKETTTEVRMCVKVININVTQFKFEDLGRSNFLLSKSLILAEKTGSHHEAVFCRYCLITLIIT